jgi:hypothetical protein
MSHHHFHSKKYVSHRENNTFSFILTSAIFQKYYGAICSLSHRNYRAIANKSFYSLTSTISKLLWSKFLPIHAQLASSCHPGPEVLKYILVN